MARLSVLFAVAGVLLLVSVAAIAEASTKTIITTTTIEEDDVNQSSRRCSQQFQQQEMLSHCMMYLREGRSPYAVSLRSVLPGNQQMDEHLQLCCRQLQNMDEQCRCEGIQMMMRQQMGQMRQQEMREMMMRARSLPGQCNMEPRECRMQAAWF